MNNKHLTNPFWGEGENKDFGRVAVEYAAFEDVIYDQRLVQYECLVNEAHVLMLYKRKIIGKEIVVKLIKGLEEIKKLDREKKFILKKELEDVHSNVERYLIEKYGLGIGGYLRLGIARNDQVYTDTRMLLRDSIIRLAEQLLNLISALTEVSKKHLFTIMPGYTHLRISQPITYAHFLTAKAYHFLDDAKNILTTYEIVNQCPLGIFEMAGTHLPIDRKYPARLLGFDKITPHSLYTANQRGELEARLLCDLSLLALHIRRTMSEVIVFSTHEFQFLKIDDLYTTGGTAQPNLKNPDTLEVVRANMAKILASLVETVMIMDALPSGFMRDTQQTKPVIINVLDLMERTLPVVCGILTTLEPNIEQMEKAANLNFATAPDVSVQLSVKGGVSFREAYRMVKSLIKDGYLKKSFKELTPSLIASLSKKILGKKITVTRKDIGQVATAKACVLSHTSYGGPAPYSVKKMIRDLRKKTGKIKKNILLKKKNLHQSFKMLESEVKILLS